MIPKKYVADQNSDIMLTKKQKDILFSLAAYFICYGIAMLVFLTLAYYYLDYKFDFDALLKEATKELEESSQNIQ